MPDNPQLGQTYTPYQIFKEIMPPMEALSKGTVFQELYRPYPGK
ncbi:MAG: spore coat associated protein CotJA [Clostridiaceae bacterium]|nr:spore coat associated protein CotJA [Clostridiaceae bacterium]